MRIIYYLLLTFLLTSCTLLSNSGFNYSKQKMIHPNTERTLQGSEAARPILSKIAGYGLNVNRRVFRSKQSKAAIKASKSSAQAVGHQAQSILLIMMITGADLVKQHIELSGIKKENIDIKLLSQHSSEAAKQILSSGEIWSSIFSSGLANLATKIPIVGDPYHKVMNFIHNKVTRPFAQQLLTQGIATFYTFFAWELGGSLFADAIELIEDDEQYEMAHSIVGSLLVKAIKEGKPLKGTEEWEVLKVIYNNVKKILDNDHDMRKLWLYNAWRKRIATGEFVVLVTAMTSAMVTASHLFPVPKKCKIKCRSKYLLISAGFGFIGGGFTLIVPEDIKHGITDYFRKFRKSFWRLGHDGNDTLFKVRKKIIDLVGNSINEGRPVAPMLKYPKSRFHARNMIMNTKAEKLYIIQSEIDIVTGKINASVEFMNQEKEIKYIDILDELKVRRGAILSVISNFYKKEIQYLEDAINRNQLSESLVNDYPIVEEIFNDLKVSKSLFAFFEEVEIEGNKESPNDHYYMTLHRFYILGFDTKLLLKEIF